MAYDVTSFACKYWGEVIVTTKSAMIVLMTEDDDAYKVV